MTRLRLRLRCLSLRDRSFEAARSLFVFRPPPGRHNRPRLERWFTFWPDVRAVATNRNPLQDEEEADRAPQTWKEGRKEGLRQPEILTTSRG